MQALQDTTAILLTCLRRRNPYSNITSTCLSPVGLSRTLCFAITNAAAMSPPQVALIQLAPTVIGVMWMQTFLAAVFVWTRIYVRIFISQAGVGWDDGFMVISWVRGLLHEAIHLTNH